MSKVTSKLQVTIPKALAVRLGIQPGDDLSWYEAGQALRIELTGSSNRSESSVEQRLQWFDQATRRQQQREGIRKPVATGKDRGWTREELYDRASAG